MKTGCSGDASRSTKYLIADSFLATSVIGRTAFLKSNAYPLISAYESPSSGTTSLTLPIITSTVNLLLPTSPSG